MAVTGAQNWEWGGVGDETGRVRENIRGGGRGVES